MSVSDNRSRGVTTYTLAMKLLGPIGRTRFLAIVIGLHNYMVVLPIPEPFQPWRMYSKPTRGVLVTLFLLAWAVGASRRLSDIGLNRWVSLPYLACLGLLWAACIYSIGQPSATLAALIITFIAQFPLMLIKSGTYGAQGRRGLTYSLKTAQSRI